MGYDIWGNPLARGHCEVHPHVHQEYPCELCMAGSQRRRDEQRQYDAAMAEDERAYYARMIGDAELASWDLSHV